MHEEPRVLRGRIRPGSAPAGRRRSRNAHNAQFTPGTHGATGAQVSQELLRRYEARKRQDDRLFARELVGDMQAIAGEYLAMVKDANRFASMLGESTHFSLSDQQSLAQRSSAEEQRFSSEGAHTNPKFDESQVLFSSKLLVKVEHTKTARVRYLSLDAFANEYSKLKSKVERRLEMLPASEAEIMMQDTPKHTDSRPPSKHGALVGAVHQAAAEKAEVDDEALTARFQALLDDVVHRKQQIDEQLQLLKQLGWNALR